MTSALAGSSRSPSRRRGKFKPGLNRSCLVMLAVAASLGVLHGQSKMAPDLKAADSSAAVNVIVQFRTVPTEQHHERMRTRGGIVRGTYHSIRSAAYSIPASSITALENDPDIVHVSVDHKVHGMLDVTAAATGASAAWVSGWTGRGIGVALIDSGISNHPDLDSRVVFKQDLVGGGTDDRYGHGEHVAGIVAGSGKTTNCPHCTRVFKGVAPEANLISFRVLDANGNGTDSAVIAAILEAIMFKAKYNIRVINLSLGRPVYESYKLDPLCMAVEAAWKSGIVVVVAAGNGGRDNSLGTNGYGTIMAPGNDPYVITVGAMKTMGSPDRSDDRIASYSSMGPTLIDHVVKPDIVAPGNLVRSLLATGSQLAQTYPQNIVPVSYYESTPQPNDSNKYFTLSGTSMATPVVSGAVADLLEAHPGLTPDQVKAKLMLTAYKSFPSTSSATDPTTGIVYTSEYDIFTIGAGYLDINALLSDQSLPTGTALSPTAVYDSASGTVHLSTSPSAVWQASGPNSVGVIWGTTAIEPTGIVWGTQVVWQTSTLSGFGVIWGTGIVWGTSTTDTTETTTTAIVGEN